jgi:hypothetical protein
VAKGGDAESQVRICDIEEVEGGETDSGQRWDDAALMPASVTGGRWEGMEGVEEEEVGAHEEEGGDGVTHLAYHVRPTLYIF